MSNTNMMLGGHWGDEWPEYVEVQKNVERHEDGVDLYRIEYRAYFPAKVCHFEPNSTWTSMRTWASEARATTKSRCSISVTSSIADAIGAARSKQVKTDWHVRTQEEADEFSTYESQKEKQWGFDPDSEWARPWREAADAAWNERS